jgi:hypothetical protein
MADHAAWGQDRPLHSRRGDGAEVLVQQKAAKQTPGSGILRKTCTSGIDLIDSQPILAPLLLISPTCLAGQVIGLIETSSCWIWCLQLAYTQFLRAYDNVFQAFKDRPFSVLLRESWSVTPMKESNFGLEHLGSTIGGLHSSRVPLTHDPPLDASSLTCGSSSHYRNTVYCVHTRVGVGLQRYYWINAWFRSTATKDTSLVLL